MDVQEFDPCAFAAKDDEVHTLCTAKRLRAPGKAIDEELHHYFRFENGKIAFYRSTEDTAQVEATLAPSASQAESELGIPV